MCYQQQQAATYNTQGLPTVFPVLNTVLSDYCEGIGKNAGSDLEANAMFYEIAFRLCWIPFKLYFNTLMLLHFCFVSRLG